MVVLGVTLTFCRLPFGARTTTDLFDIGQKWTFNQGLNAWMNEIELSF